MVTTEEYMTKDEVMGIPLSSICYNLNKLRGITGTKDKEAFLRSKEEDTAFLYVLKVLLDTTIVLGLKQIQSIGINTRFTERTFEEFYELLHTLQTSNINDVIRSKVQHFLTKCSEHDQEILIAVLCKTYKIGVTSKTVNKVFPGMVHEFSCMLADSGMPEKFPVIVGLKYDGVRCVGLVQKHKVQMFTRQGNLISLPHIEKELLALANGSELIFDGELLSTDSALRTSISGTINSILKTGYTETKGANVCFKVFDSFDLELFKNKLKTPPLRTRLLDLSKRFYITKGLVYTSEALHQVAHSESDILTILKEYLDAGEEGVIIKDLDASYEYKRSKAWLKMKAINSGTFKVIGTTEGTNDRKGKIGAFVCASEDFKVQFNVGSGLTDDDLNNVTPEGITGKYVEVIFNVLIKGENSNAWSLFLPRLKKGDWLRIDKAEADTIEKLLVEHIGTPVEA